MRWTDVTITGLIASDMGGVYLYKPLFYLKLNFIFVIFVSISFWTGWKIKGDGGQGFHRQASVVIRLYNEVRH